MLLRAVQLAQHTPFVWGSIDKPQGSRAQHLPVPYKVLIALIEGQVYLIFLTHQLPFPPDGIRYQDQEQKIIIPAGANRVRLFPQPSVINYSLMLVSGIRGYGG